MSSKVCSSPGCNNPCHIDKDLCLEHHKEQEGYTYGLDAEIKKKMDAKFDPTKASQAQAWIEHLTNMRATGTFQEFLKTGIILCKAVNMIKPNIVPKINTLPSPFKERENIASYLNACKLLGCRDTDLFMTQDLYENANMNVVIDNIHALGGLSRKVTSFHGPYLGVKFAEENKRNFTDEQLRANVPSRQTVGSYGYQDESHTPTLSRQIVKDVSGHKAAEVPSQQTQGSYGYESAPANKLDKIIKSTEVLEANKKGTAGVGQFCSSCGVKRQGSAKFCSECGTPY